MNKLTATKLSGITLSSFKELMAGGLTITLDKKEVCRVKKNKPSSFDGKIKEMTFTNFKRCDKQAVRDYVDGGNMFRVSTSHNHHVCYLTK